MATLEIEGRKVQVDDSFLQLSPEDQSKTVDEIASQLNIAPSQTSLADAQSELSDLTQKAGAQQPDPGSDGLSQVRTGLGGLIEGIPIAGPLIRGGVDRAAAGTLSMMYNKPYADVLKRIQSGTADEKAANPGIDATAQITGGIASMVPIGATATGAKLLGMTGKTLGARVGASALSGAGISAADQAARGGDLKNIGASALIGGGIGGAIPVVGSGLNAATGYALSKAAPTVNAILNPAKEASRRVGTALERDLAANPSAVLNAADEAMAKQAGIPLTNADRGGEVTRALSRSVANQSPESRQAIEKLSSDRFASQSVRASDFMKRIAGNQADDLAFRDNVDKMARMTNKPAYDAAYNAPAAQQVYTPGIQELMQSPTFQNAVKTVPERSADRGAVQGFKRIANPFKLNSKGDYVLQQKGDGTLIAPNLKFWDQVKQNLDSEIGIAQRAGDKPRVSDLMGLKTKLVDELDGLVPQYQKARAGAAAFFGQDNAVDAGKAFARNLEGNPEAARAIAKFSPKEREAFAVGHASELVDMIKRSGDRMNVINSIFKNQARREQLSMVYGPEKAAHIEAYVRVEDLADRLRGALGNSTTARQLVEMGLGAGGGYAMSGGDWQAATAGAALAAGVRYGSGKIEADVMQRMAALLTSDNLGALKMAVEIAGRNPKYMVALEKLGTVLAPASRGVAVQSGQ